MDNKGDNNEIVKILIVFMVFSLLLSLIVVGAEKLLRVEDNENEECSDNYPQSNVHLII